MRKIFFILNKQFLTKIGLNTDLLNSLYGETPRIMTPVDACYFVLIVRTIFIILLQIQGKEILSLTKNAGLERFDIDYSLNFIDLLYLQISSNKFFFIHAGDR